MTTAVLPDYEDVVRRYDPVIGLEVHVELGTRTKMFCGCPTTFGAEPNTQVCPVCLGLPGSLPVANRAAIEATIRIGLALHCDIAGWCRFARKNYFYPDMPKNFQISQYDEPLCTDGWLDVDVDGETVRVGIERVHLEEDTGKTLHLGGSTGRIHGATESLVDYNRAGIPLVEIVTKPVASTGALAPTVARAYVTELRDVVRTLGVSDVRMEQGSLRCDVNTSLAPAGSAQWGTRTETKNVNSLRSVERAVRSEMLRQAAVLDAGERVVQETRHFREPGSGSEKHGREPGSGSEKHGRREPGSGSEKHGRREPGSGSEKRGREETGDTIPGRSKETATDYRYFPEPDLVPLAPDRDWVASLAAGLPELPRERRHRLQAEWQLSDLDMQALVNAGALELVAATVAAGATPEAARKWWLGELSRRANEAGVELAALGIDPADVAALQRLVDEGKLSDKLARTVLDGVLAGEGTPAEVMAARGLAVVSDTATLTAAVDEAIAANPEVAAKVRDGKVAAAGVLVGAVMKATRGQADAKVVREMVLARLGGSS